MKKDPLNVVFDDISIIKNFIRENKSPHEKIYKLLLFIGIINLVYYGLTTVGAILISDINLLQSYSNLTSTLNAIMYLVLFIYFIKIYKQEKTGSNKYYLSFLNIFAGITFLLPLFMLSIRIMLIFAPNENMGASLKQLQEINMISNILLFCFFAILCGLILKGKSMLIASVVTLFVYLMLLTVYSDIRYTIEFSKTNVSMSLLSIYYSLAISLGYIIMATILKNRYRVSNTNGIN